MSGFEPLRVSSAGDGKGRWTELELAGFEDGSYELTVTGVSDEPGEWDLSKSRGCDTPQEVVDALRAPSGRLSHLAVQLLAEAAKVDDKFRNLELEEHTHADRPGGRRRGRQVHAG